MELAERREQTMQVVALIHEENGVYGASFPDFPGCTTAATDPDTVIAKAAEVLARHIEGMIADGLELPQVRALSQLAGDPFFVRDAAGVMIALVSCTPAARAVRLNVTLDESLLARIDRAAEAAGETRSEYLAGAARQRLAHDAVGCSDAAIPSVPPIPHIVEASGMAHLAGDAVPSDAAASLECIKDILGRLDPSCERSNS